MSQQLETQVASDFLQRLHAAVNAHDARAVAALCSDDVL
jgi:ketosteroid isomerase-like protein